MFDNITDRFISANVNADRHDLFVCDMQRMDREKCAALIAYDQQLDVPKMADIYKYVAATFNGKVIAQVSTAKTHGTAKCVSVVLTANMMQRPESDKSTMRAITATTFAEDKTGSLWAVHSDASGRRCLVRNQEEDIADIVARVVRPNRVNAEAKFASLKSAAPMCDVGDVVAFFGPANELLHGTVSSVNGEYVTINADKSGSHTVSKYSVAAINQKGKGAQAREKADLQVFFAKIYGSEEFASQLVRNDVNDQGIQDV